MVKTLLNLLAIFFLLQLMSCHSDSKKLTDQQQLFLDFAQLEDEYRGSSYYYNLDLHSDYEEEPVYYDSLFNILQLEKDLQQKFTINTSEGFKYRFSYFDTGYPIQYPHEIIIIENKKDTYNVKFSIFIPEGFEQFSLSKNDIGTHFTKEGMNITLLDLRNDGATLLVENTAKTRDYDYTFNQPKKERTSEPYMVGYEKNLFTSESLNRPNEEYEYRTKRKDTFRIGFDRLNISVKDTKGKTIRGEGSIYDFRHYSWYRTKDMPYPHLEQVYDDLYMRYREQITSDNYNLNPIHIINLKASGRIGSLNFFLRSNNGRVEVIDIKDLVAQKEQEETTSNNEYPIKPTYKPYNILTDSIIKNELKTRKIKLSNKKKNQYIVYTTLPDEYSELSRIFFHENYLKSSNKDSLYIFESNSFNAGLRIDKVSNFESFNIEIPDTIYDSVKGKVEVTYSNYIDSKYDMSNLPDKYIYHDEENMLDLVIENYYDDTKLFAFTDQDLITTIPYRIERGDKEKHFFIHFKTPPKVIIVRITRQNNPVDIPYELELNSMD